MRRVIAVVLCAYLAFMLSITLLILPMDHPKPNLVPFRSMAHDWRVGGQSFVVNFVGNIVAFIPFGLMIPAVRSRASTLGEMVLVGVVLSGSIELAQYATGRRVGDIDDVFLNTLGVLVGFAAIRTVRAKARRRSRDRPA